jgi:hypothetical protein
VLLRRQKRCIGGQRLGRRSQSGGRKCSNRAADLRAERRARDEKDAGPPPPQGEVERMVGVV